MAPVRKRLRICKEGHKYYKSGDCPACPVCEEKRKPNEGFLSALSAPARRALEREGILSLKKLSSFSSDQILKLHGIGPSTIPKLKKALAEKKLSFSKSASTKTTPGKIKQRISKIKTTLTLLITLFAFSCNHTDDKNKKSEGHNTSDSLSVKKDVLSDTSDVSARSEITCPSCGYKKMENMPTEVCLLKYTCEKCNTLLFPKEGDCCVFCTYGTHKCPSKQE